MAKSAADQKHRLVYRARIQLQTRISSRFSALSATQTGHLQWAYSLAVAPTHIMTVTEAKAAREAELEQLRRDDPAAWSYEVWGADKDLLRPICNLVSQHADAIGLSMLDDGGTARPIRLLDYETGAAMLTKVNPDMPLY